MKKNKIWSIVELILWTEQYFKEKNITNAKLEVEWLLCHLLSCSRIDLYLKFDTSLNKNVLDQFKSLIQRRAIGEPFQHIIEKGTFFGRDFFVNSNVLIPRPETELIIERLKNKKSIRSLLDVGTGSGCIAITSFLEKLCNKITAIDISKEALQVAKKNAVLLNANSIKFKLHDFLKNNLNQKFDVIVSNPPYIELNQIQYLDTNIRKFEPHIALTDFQDGLSFYRKFAIEFHNLINKNGLLILEINNKINIKKILNIFNKKNLNVDIFKDLQNDNRVIEIYE